MDRVATFKSFITQRPDDPFPVYGLAMELKGRGDHAEAQEWFDRLRDQFPSYVAGYFHGGQNLVALGRKHDATALFRKGVEVATAAGDGKTRDELLGALAELE